MYAAVILLVSLCLTAATLADHHHRPCHSPNMTGHMTVTDLKGDVRAKGVYTYDSTANKLRFRSNQTEGCNTSLTLDVLIFFDEALLYVIDSKNQTCEKDTLESVHSPLELPPDAKLISTINIGSAAVEGEGLKVNVWTGICPETKVRYSISSTMACLPVSSKQYTDSTTLIFTNIDVETEIKEPELLTLPSFCEGVPLEETADGEIHSFVNLFI